MHATGMLDAWEYFADQTKHWQALEGPDELGDLMMLLESTCGSLEEKCGAVKTVELSEEESEEE